MAPQNLEFEVWTVDRNVIEARARLEDSDKIPEPRTFSNFVLGCCIMRLITDDIHVALRNIRPVAK